MNRDSSSVAFPKRLILSKPYVGQKVNEQWGLIIGNLCFWYKLRAIAHSLSSVGKSWSEWSGTIVEVNIKGLLHIPLEALRSFPDSDFAAIIYFIFGSWPEANCK